MKNILAIFLLLTIFSCEKSPGEQAEVSEAKEIQAPPPKAAVSPVHYTIRPAASEITWIGSKPTGKHYGTIGIESGTIVTVDGKINGGKIVLDMDDIEVQDLKSDEDSHMKLTEHLKSDDFFDVENYPHAQFELSNIIVYDSAARKEQELFEQNNKSKLKASVIDPTHKITGNLTLRDTTLSISFPAYVLFDAEQIIMKAQFIIDRTLWNVSYHEEAEFTDKVQDKLIYNDVVVGFDILANPEKVL